MKFIGDILMNKTKISKENLLDCLVEKHDSIPRLPKIIYDNKILSVDDQLNVYKYMQENKAGYLDACEKLSLMSDETKTKITRVIEANQMTLSQVLLNKKLVQNEEIIEVWEKAIEMDSE